MMDYILQELRKTDADIEEIFHKEGIDEVNIFVDLNEQDFVRLRLRTKTIKVIQRLQKEFESASIVEEYIVEESGEDCELGDVKVAPVFDSSVSCAYRQPEQVHVDAEREDEETQDNKTQSNPYKGILLEKKINIDRIFERTDDGMQVMESLKQGEKPNDKMLTRIKKLLCEYLQLTYGMRPSAFHKNIMAVSLVDTYPILRSTTPDVPQALWFYPNARGQHRHSGRLHYHLEYLVRKSTDRKILRVKRVATPTDPLGEGSLQAFAYNIEQMIEELKFLCPGPNTRKRAEELWDNTFEERNKFRKTEEFHLFLMECPAATAFDGYLLKLDFLKLHPQARSLEEVFGDWSPRILAAYPETLQHIPNETVRALGIIRMQNPSRGKKRLRDDTSSSPSVNPLSGIVEWLNVDDPFPTAHHEHPVLYARGSFPENPTGGIISWRGITIDLQMPFLGLFETLCQAWAVFNVECRPSDKQFFVFLSAVLMGVGNITTTGEKFLRRLN
ncbi:uncharacterized protein LOC134204360 [Armigeres subalbatus]|uniref:uncharacterized protein LOC134204360 n=1 Tax=Armigeres subalbatus TaxID=124917 RepID=UPI002ED0E36F